ncbi:MAG TPA: biopolymer transporter ExbD [Fimbriimonadaceae bacterium]|jgi:biopolymer transport protein ExbD
MKLAQPEFKRARIEIVPMIDTIFFLLVFFMIASLSMVKLNSKKVSLPQSETANISPTNSIALTVDKAGNFLVNKEVLPEAQVLPTLQNLLRANPQKQVVLNCDRELPVKYFVHAYDYAKQANATHVMLATSPRSQTKGAP